jgi:hypothetical protein
MNVEIAGDGGPYVTAAIVAAIAAVVAEQIASAAQPPSRRAADSWTPVVRESSTDPDLGWAGLRHPTTDFVAGG